MLTGLKCDFADGEQLSDILKSLKGPRESLSFLPSGKGSMSRPPAEEEEEPGPLAAAASDAVKDKTDDNTAAVPNQIMVTEVLMAVESTSTCYTFKLPRTTRMLKSSSLTPFCTIESFPYPSQIHT